MDNSVVKKQGGIFTIPVLVAALGYFVDIYDLLLFSIIRVTSLKEMGLNIEIKRLKPYKPDQFHSSLINK